MGSMRFFLAAVAVLGAGAVFADFVEVQDGPAPAQMEGEGEVIIDGGEQVVQPQMPTAPQVQQILQNVKAGNAKSRDGAEQKLVELGASAVALLKGQAGGQKGLAKDALLVAVFRLENSPLAPRELLSEWAAKKVGADPATVILQRVMAEDLWKLFPHHLFYVAEVKGTN
jgi:hypothetical protein